MSYTIPEGKLYDLSMIHEIAHGNQDFVNKMMQLFIDTMPPALSELRQHYNDKNWASLGAVAHKIKPSIDTMGIELLREDIRALEKYGKEATNLDLIPELLEKVEAVVNKIIEALKSTL
ncbi:MAG: Hpt domain-containing protein [Bacteroidia bacterium]|jgi:HPt (histidine-containing phosphotransfer) domain-containing protein